jgi:hypothetical protein
MIKDNGFEFEMVKTQLHPFLSEIIEYHKIENINEYKIYQLCRNPFDRIISSFYFQKKIIKDKKRYKEFIDLSFDDFVKLITDNVHLLSQDIDSFCENVFNDSQFSTRHLPSAYGIRFYIPQTKWANNSINVTYLKIEDLNEDLSILQNILDIDKKLILPKINSNHIDTSYNEMYSNENIEIIKKVYSEDFLKLNYFTKLK